MNTDLIIIGAGPGGYEMAVEAAAKGLTVVIFEENKPGGTCLNEGCIPTKALCRNAEVAETLKRAAEFGIGLKNVAEGETDDLGNLEIDMKAIQTRKQAVVDQLVAGVEGLLSKPGITLVRAHAEFKDAKTVVANGEEYTAQNIVIATGSESRLLPVPGMNLAGVLTSKEMLEIDYLPKHLCVIGAGVIGLEFASIFHRLGSEVTMVEFAKEILPPFDSDIAKRLKQTLTKQGIVINTSAGVTGIEPLSAEAPAQGLRVNFEQKGKQLSVEADTVLVAVGRGARVEGINLETTGVEFSRRGIVVDENMQTNVHGIYAIGDVNARCMLAHAATFQGFRALNHILAKADGKIDNIRLDIVPAAVFCQPEAAMVGMTEEQCRVASIAVKAHKSFFRANGKALSMGEPDGFCKLIAEKESGKILGCHLFGAHSADLIQEIAALMNKDATVDELAEIIHAHPTLGEVILSAAKA